MLNRKIEKIITPKGSEGFLGRGHIAVPVLGGTNYERSNPFIFLMDDQLNLPGGGPVGGPHPHAGIETVTLILEADENHGFEGMRAGDVEWMTAGGGVIHGEDITDPVRTRLLQLWLVLPKARRQMKPRTQHLEGANIPVRREQGAEIRVYSGVSGEISGPAENETPVTIVEVRLNAGAEIVQEIPAGYNGFLYVISGSVDVGAEGTVVKEGQVGWLERVAADGKSQVKFVGVDNGTRFVFYAGRPQEGRVIQHGPFVGETQEDIVRLYREFREGKMHHVREAK